MRMSRSVLLLLGLLLVLGVQAVSAQQVHTVNLMIEEVEGGVEFYFSPVGLFIAPGDTVVFRGLTPHHTVTAYHAQHGKAQRVPDGVPPFSSPVVPVGLDWSYEFVIPGVYDLWCAPHESYGMVMRIVVGEATGPGAVPSTDFGPFGTFDLAGAILNAQAMSPERIIAQGKVMWSDVRAELLPAQ